MDTKETFGLGTLDGGDRQPDPPSASDTIGRSTRWIRKAEGAGSKPAKRPRQSRQPQPGGFDALQDRPEEKRGVNEQVSPVNPEDRARAQTILDEIGKRFADNRKKGKSNAYERYQADLAENLNYLVAGGVMNLKEISQTIMQLEEFRKQTSESGKTQATLLGEFLRGEITLEVLK